MIPTSRQAAVADQLLAEWDLDVDGDPVTGHRALILPVRTAGGTALLKVAAPEQHNAHEHLVLRKWNGGGAVRLLRADPRRRSLLLERLGAEDLTTIPEDQACAVVAGLYRQLHRPALPQLTSLSELAPTWRSDLGSLPRSAPIPRRLVEQAIANLADLDGAEDEVTLHGNLHHGKVLAAQRTPWLVVGPAPLRGDPHYEVAPMLWSRWDRMGHQARQVIRQRLFIVTDTAEFDEDRARAWALIRAVLRALRLVRAGAPTDSVELTRFVTVAKAVQD